MKLTLSHNDVVTALCQYLGAQGMSAFDPTVVTAEFGFKRGTKELTCELDTEAKPVVEAEPAPKKQPVVTQTATTSVADVAPQEDAPAVVVEEPAQTVTVEEVVTATPESGAAVAAGDDDNLFD